MTFIKHVCQYEIHPVQGLIVIEPHFHGSKKIDPPKFSPTTPLPILNGCSLISIALLIHTLHIVLAQIVCLLQSEFY